MNPKTFYFERGNHNYTDIILNCVKRYLRLETKQLRIFRFTCITITV